MSFVLKVVTNLLNVIVCVCSSTRTHGLGGSSVQQASGIRHQIRSQPSRQAKALQISMMDEQDTSQRPKKFKQDNVPKSRLVFQARGFKGIYDESFRLDILSRFLDRH